MMKRRQLLASLRSVNAIALLIACASTHLPAQSPRGTVRVTDSSSAEVKAPGALAVRVLAGTARSRIEIDTLDWRPKWTLRLNVTEPDTGVVIIRWATAARPKAGTYPVKIISSGASHSDPKFATATLSEREHDGAREYVIGEFDNRVVVQRVGADGSVAGTFSFRASRYATKGSTIDATRWVYRVLHGSFESAPASAGPRPVMTPVQQQHILSRALVGFAITWVGAMNGDGSADSTHSVAKVRAFLATRWKDALIVDSLATSAKDFFIRVHGRIIPIVCTVTPNDFEPRCVPPSVTGRAIGLHQSPGRRGESLARVTETVITRWSIYMLRGRSSQPDAAETTACRRFCFYQFMER